MADRDNRYLFSVILQALGANNTKKEVDSVTDALQRNQSAINSQASAAQDVAGSFSKINNAIPFDALSSDIDNSTARMKLLNNELEKANNQTFADVQEEFNQLPFESIPASNPKNPKNPKNGGRGGGLQQLGSNIFNLPSIQIPGQTFGTDTIGRGIRALGQLEGSLQTFTPQAIGATSAIGALTGIVTGLILVFSEARDEVKQYREAILAEAEARGQINRELAGGELGLEIAEERLRQNEAFIASEQALVAERDAFLRGFELYDFSETNLNPLQSGGLDSFFNEINEASFLALGRTVGDFTVAQIDAFREANAESQTAINEAIAQNEALTATYEELLEAQQELDRQQSSKFFADVLEFAQTASVEDVQERIAALGRANEVERQRIALYGESEVVTREANAIIEENNEKIQLLNEFALERAAANDALIETEQRFIELQQKAISEALRIPEDELRRSKLFESINLEGFNDAVQTQQDLLGVYEEQARQLEIYAANGVDVSDELAVVEENARLAKEELAALANEGLNSAIFNQVIESGKEFKAVLDEAGVATKELSDNLDSELTKLADQLAKSISDAAKKRDRALEDLDDKTTRDRLKAQADRNEKLEDLEADLAAKRAKILRDFGRDSLNAIANRDALALFLAKQKRDDELADLDDSATERRNKINEEYNKQTADILEKLRLQREEILETYEQRRQDAIENEQRLAERARQEYQQRLQLLQQQTAQELNIRRQAVANELAELTKLNIQGTGIIGSFVTNALSYIDRLANSSRRGSSGTRAERLQNTVTRGLGSIFNAGGMNLTVNTGSQRGIGVTDTRTIISEVDKRINKLLTDGNRVLTR